MKKGLQYIVSLTIILSLIASLIGINVKYHHCYMMKKTNLAFVFNAESNKSNCSVCEMEKTKTFAYNVDKKDDNNPGYSNHCCDNQKKIFLANYDLINHSEKINLYPFVNHLFYINISNTTFENHKYKIIEENFARIVHRKYGQIFLQFISRMNA